MDQRPVGCKWKMATVWCRVLPCATGTVSTIASALGSQGLVDRAGLTACAVMTDPVYVAMATGGGCDQKMAKLASPPAETIARVRDWPRRHMNIATKGMSIDLTNAVWRKSSRSGPSTDNWVEVAFVDGAIAVRDSSRPDGPILLFTPAEWDAFVDGAKDGEFDL